MRDVAQDFFSASPVMAAPLVALLIFFVVFILVLVRATRTRHDVTDRAAHLALEGEEARDVAK